MVMSFASYELYQMKTGPETENWLFQDFAVLTAQGYYPTMLDYKLVFASCLRPGVAPETLCKQLAGFAQRTHKFRGINTGDVLVLRTDDGAASYYLEHGEAIPFDGFFGKTSNGGTPLTPETERYVIPGKAGTWRVIDTKVINDRWYYLMESEKYGADSRWIILNGNGKVIQDDNITAFDDETVRRIQSAQNTPQTPRRLEIYQQYLENGEYLRSSSSEVNEEQNYNMIDGTRNNCKRKPGPRRSIRARLREKQRLLHGGQPEENRVLEKR